MSETITIDRLFWPSLELEVPKVVALRVRSLEDRNEKLRKEAQAEKWSAMTAKEFQFGAEQNLARAKIKIADRDRQIERLVRLLAAASDPAKPSPAAADPRPAPPRATNPRHPVPGIRISPQGQAAITALFERDPPDINAREDNP